MSIHHENVWPLRERRDVVRLTVSVPVGARKKQTGRQGRADTLQVRPCKLAVAILGDTTVGTTLPASLFHIAISG